MFFNEVLLRWFDANGRSLPWRNIQNEYYIWVSEIILQQTRVAQGIDYYYNFIKQFPTVNHLANAPLDLVMKSWQGLGYYTRARNMHIAAKQIMSDYGGKLPNTYSELLKIKGLGNYSAAAIASFAFDEAVPAVDGNVYRILSRVFGVFTPIDSTKGKREFFNLATELIDKEHPASFNQAIIDYGAMVCTYRLPNCQGCVFVDMCYAFSNNIVGKLPVKGKKLAVRSRYFTYLMINHCNYTFIKSREDNDIWHSLYEFPLIETDAPMKIEDLVQLEQWRNIVGDGEVVISSISESVKHQLSHQTIYATFIILDVQNVGYMLKSEYSMVEISKIDSYSIPRLLDVYMAAEPSLKYFTKVK